MIGLVTLLRFETPLFWLTMYYVTSFAVHSIVDNVEHRMQAQPQADLEKGVTQVCFFYLLPWVRPSL